MSTDYYRLKDSISSIRIEDSGPHTQITIWQKGANCGTLTFRDDDDFIVSDIVRALTGDRIAHTHWGGDSQGCVVEIFDSSMKDDDKIISDYDEILTIKELKLLHGKGRRSEP